MPYSPTVWVSGSTPLDQTELSNLETQYSEATNSFERDLFTAYVLSGLVATKDGTTANQLDVTSGVAFLLQADNTLRRRAPTSSTQVTSALTSTYHLYLQPDGTWYWSTSNSPASNSLFIAQVVTDGSGNISTVTDERVLNTTLFSGMLGVVKLNALYSDTGSITSDGSGNITAVKAITSTGAIATSGNISTSGGTLTVHGSSSLDNGNITTNGSGNLTAKGLIANTGGLSVSGGGITVTSGSTSLDNGQITTNGSGQATAKKLVANTSGLSVTAGGISVTGGSTSLDNGAFTTDGSGNITTVKNITFGNGPILKTLQSGSANGITFETWSGAANVVPFSVGGQFNSALAWVDASGNYNGDTSCGIPTSRNTGSGAVATSVPIYTGTTTPTTPPTGSIWIKA